MRLTASNAHSLKACTVLLGLQLTIPCIWVELGNVHPGAIAVLSEGFLVKL